MDHPEKRKKTRKNRIMIHSKRQMELFEVGSSVQDQDESSVKWRSHRVFKHRDPKEIRIGALRLDEYLEKAELKEPFIVRSLLEGQDWGVFEERYGIGGCAAYEPQAMVGLILYGMMQGEETLRGLELLTRKDLGCMWVSGGIMPDHSTIGRFVGMHGEHLSGEFFESLTKAVLKKTGSGTGSLAGDGTVLQAVASRYKTVKREAAEVMAREARERAEDSGDKALEAKAKQAQEVLEVLQERIEARKAKGKDVEKVQVSPSEPDAVVQPLKEGGCAPSYKPSVLANEDRIVVGYEVDPSNESRCIPAMVDMAERIGSERVDDLMLDAGYFGHSVIQECIKRDINLLCPEGKSMGEGKWTKKGKLYSKSAFWYDEGRDIYICPHGHEMYPVERYSGTGKNVGYVSYGTGACVSCPFRSKCTDGKEGRRVKRYKGDDAKDALREVMKDPRARTQYRKRQSMVEPVFGYMKRVLKFTRFRRRGLGKVKVEFALYVLAYNLCRIVALAHDRAAAFIFGYIYMVFTACQGLWEKFADICWSLRGIEQYKITAMNSELLLTT